MEPENKQPDSPTNQPPASKYPHPTDNPLTIDASFAVLESCLRTLAEIAPVNSPRQLRVLLPTDLELGKQLILSELIKVDLATANTVGKTRTLDFYWPDLEEDLPRDSIPIDLALEEARILQRSGVEVDWQALCVRFPDLQNTLADYQSQPSHKGNAGTNVGGDVERSTLPASPPSLSIPSRDLETNQRIDDFQILKLLGRGAFAQVYLARQESMQRLVALKVSSRGSEEPQALAKLDHANIVRVYDQRKINSPEANILFMQYIPGGTLSDCIAGVACTDYSERTGRILLSSIDASLLDALQTAPEASPIREHITALTWTETVAWLGIQLAEGLGYASTQGVLHRDVKPANILLSSEGIPKLADFNVSCSGIDGSAGASAFFGGSLAYMSPEQLAVADPTDITQASELDVRSDLFSLGIVLWELWQGVRPWPTANTTNSWTGAIRDQSASRQLKFSTLQPCTTPEERLLESVLQKLLSYSREDRPKSGEETAARMRLALHPELARRFEPTPRSLNGRLLSIPVLVLSALLIFIPNIAASRFNYVYNSSRMVSDFVDTGLVPTMETDFQFLANWVNGIVFPLGAMLFWIIAQPINQIVSAARRGVPANKLDIDRLWSIGYKATIVCGVLWAVSGSVFAIGLSSMHTEFDADDAFHFFMSLVLCGGVAWIYPYFGMTLLSVLIYFPKVIALSMNDPGFDARCKSLKTQCHWYLISAATIPLLAIGLLVFRESLPRQLILLGVSITAVGLLAAYFACEKLKQAMGDFSQVLGAASQTPSRDPI